MNEVGKVLRSDIKYGHALYTRSLFLRVQIRNKAKLITYNRQQRYRAQFVNLATFTVAALWRFHKTVVSKPLIAIMP